MDLYQLSRAEETRRRQLMELGAAREEVGAWRRLVPCTYLFHHIKHAIFVRFYKTHFLVRHHLFMLYNPPSVTGAARAETKV
jgi:dihydrodipicolinate synthase/N-acetylneuraminate lyase